MIEYKLLLLLVIIKEFLRTARILFLHLSRGLRAVVLGAVLVAVADVDVLEFLSIREGDGTRPQVRLHRHNGVLGYELGTELARPRRGRVDLNVLGQRREQWRSDLRFGLVGLLFLIFLFFFLLFLFDIASLGGVEPRASALG